MCDLLGLDAKSAGVFSDLRFYLPSYSLKERSFQKCLHCGKLFTPDARNYQTQRYCGEKDCHKASKTASQKKWLGKSDCRKDFSHFTSEKLI